VFDFVPAAWTAELWAAPVPSVPGDAHYVSCREGGQVLLLVGPFGSAAQAGDWVATAQDVLLRDGRLENALSAQVTRLIGPDAARPGDLNGTLGVQVDQRP
jgi:hypothetical protein